MVFVSEVEVVNLSLGGVAIRTDRRLNIGGEYVLRLEVGDQFVEVKASVVWSVLSEIRKKGEADAAPEYSAGLRFQDVFTENLRGLMNFIDEHKIFEEHRLGGMRFQIDAPGKALLDSPEGYKVRLISLSGMLIETERALEVDAVYPMEIAPAEKPAIRFSGRVASCLEVLDATPKHFDIGVAFVSMSPEDEARLGDFIASVSVHSV